MPAEFNGMIPNLTREAYNEFPPNLTSISCLVKFEIQPGGIEFDPPSNWVEITGMIPNLIREAYNVISVNFQLIQLASISMDLLPIQPVEFGCKFIEMIPNLTRQAYNVISVNFQ